MCDFPFRRESGTGNRIPGDFFVSFFGRAKKEMPAGMRRPEKPVPPRHERTKKNKRPSAKDMTFKPTIIFIRVGRPGDRSECTKVAGLPWGGVRPAR